MDITSYLLGKQAGGGSTPTLQTKSVTITENTTTEVTPDSGYDGLEKVNVTTNVPSGGGSVEEKDVDFIDYDGTLLHSYTKAEFLALTAMPENPSHEGLTAQGWNWSLSDAKTYVTDTGGLVIGQTYTTASGLSEFDIELNPATGLSVTLKMSGTKNWGDGTSDSTTSHTYSTYGNYTITCNGTIGTNTFLFDQSNSDNNYYVKNIRLATTENSFISSIFYYCFSLETITICNGTKYINSGVFAECPLLKTVVFPNTVLEIDSSSLYNDRGLQNVSLPNSITNLGTQMFYGCNSIKKFCVPSGITTIKGSLLNACYNLERILIPKNITSIDASAFGFCYKMKIYDFRNFEAVPT